MARLKAAIGRMDRTKVVSERPDYLQLEFRSKLIGYVDDVEFLLDAQQRKIHVRSASRVGRYDFGANRKRIEAVRAAFSSGGL